MGRGQAVYVTGAAAEAPEAELSGAGSLRLYRLRVERHEVHVGGSDPEHGTGRDRRVEVDLSGG